MANSFTPIAGAVTSASASATVAQPKPVTILAKTQAASVCSPLFHRSSKRDLPPAATPLVTPPHHASSGFAALSPHRSESEPKITLQRNGDQITQIRIQCACGQIIELVCEY